MLTKNNLKVTKTVEARKEKIPAEAAWKLLGAAQEVIVGKGKKILMFHPAQDDEETILNSCLGRTGNLRAPTIKTGNQVIVGFNDAMYKDFIE